MRIAVLGAGAWGTALAITFAGDHDVRLWVWDPAELEALRATRENRRFLAGFAVPPGVRIDGEVRAALDGADLALLVVPTGALRETLHRVADVSGTVPVIWACKGFEPASAKLPHQVAGEVLGNSRRLGVLSGPSFAVEVARGLPTAVTLACNDEAYAASTVREINSQRLRLYHSADVIGVEVGGAVKNVIAIAAGISDGLGFGLNARAALITRGLAEMTRLGMRLGGHQETFLGLSGAGDLILTCTGDLSRNRRVGLALAEGKSLDAILSELGHVAEGVHTASEVRGLARQLKVEMPITDTVCRMLFEALEPRRAVEALLSREPKAEGA